MVLCGPFPGPYGLSIQLCDPRGPHRTVQDVVEQKAALQNHPKVLQLLCEEGSTPKDILDTKKEQGMKKKTVQASFTILYGPYLGNTQE